MEKIDTVKPLVNIEPKKVIPIKPIPVDVSAQKVSSVVAQSSPPPISIMSFSLQEGCMSTFEKNPT